MHFQPMHFPFGPQTGAFSRGQFVIRPGVLIIMGISYREFKLHGYARGVLISYTNQYMYFK